MRKITYLFPLLTIILLFLFVSCNVSDNRETVSEESTEIVTKDGTNETEITMNPSTETVITETSETQEVTKPVSYWDNLINHQPTEEKLQLIHKGMTFNEVCEIIGKPHMLDPNDSSLRGYGRVWVTTNGDSYCLYFSLPDDVDVDSISSKDELYGKLLLDENPYLVKTRFKYEYSSTTASYTIDGIDYYQLDKHTDYYITVPSTSVDDVRVVYKIVDGKPIDVTDDCIFYNDFFDTKLENQPTIEEINMIHEGMTYQEIEEIIGRPHRKDPNYQPVMCVWTTSEGNDYALFLKTTASISSNVCYRYSDYMKTTVLSYRILRIKTHFCLEVSSSGEAFCTIDGVSYYQIEKHSIYYLTTPSTVVDETCTIYKIIDNVPVDVTDDCDWYSTMRGYWYDDWHPKYD